MEGDSQPPLTPANPIPRDGRALNPQSESPMWVSVIRVLAVAFFGFCCLSLLGLAALNLFGFKRAGAVSTSDARLWFGLKVVQYGLLLLIVVVAAAGVASTWALLALATPLGLVWFEESRIKRRAGAWPPPWFDEL